MEHLTTIEREFDAGHRLPDGLCNRTHGHRYRVRVTALGYYLPEKGESYEWPQLDVDLQLIISELDKRDLNEMMHGANPSADGVALWIMERLVGSHPKITEVSVTDFAEHSVTIRRTPR